MPGPDAAVSREIRLGRRSERGRHSHPPMECRRAAGQPEAQLERERTEVRTEAEARVRARAEVEVEVGVMMMGVVRVGVVSVRAGVVRVAVQVWVAGRVGEGTGAGVVMAGVAGVVSVGVAGVVVGPVGAGVEVVGVVGGVAGGVAGVVRVVRVRVSVHAVRSRWGSALVSLYSCIAPSAIPSVHAEGLLLSSRIYWQGTPALRF